MFETRIASNPSDPTPTAIPPLVILVGEAAMDQQRISHLLETGSIVVLAPGMKTVSAWLPSELLRRVQAEPPHVIITVNGLEIDLTEHRARWSGQPLDLTEYELNLLASLAEDPGRAWTFNELLSKVWGVSFHGHPDVVHAAVKRLRKKLAQISADLTVQSVRGVGFRLAAHSRLRRLVRARSRPRPKRH